MTNPHHPICFLGWWGLCVFEAAADRHLHVAPWKSPYPAKTGKGTPARQRRHTKKPGPGIKPNPGDHPIYGIGTYSKNPK